MKLRAVLDTSTLIGSQRDNVVYAAKRNAYQIVWSAFLIAEFARIRTELAIRNGVARSVYRARINAAVSEITRLAKVVDCMRLQGGNYQIWLRDADDEPLLATALVGKAHYSIVRKAAVA